MGNSEHLETLEGEAHLKSNEVNFSCLLLSRDLALYLKN